MRLKHELIALDEPSPGVHFDTAITCLLGLMLAFAPTAFGAVEAWSEEIFIALAGVTAICFAAKLLVYREVRFFWSWTYLPIALFVALVTFQLVPLPAGVVGRLSPHTLSWKTRLLADLPNASGLLKRITLSFYPLATRHDLRLLLAVSAIFVVVANVYRSRRQVIQLLTLVVVVGGIQCVLAMLQDLTGADKILWYFKGNLPKANAGTFIHYSHYSQFANLFVGAALALILSILYRGSSAAGRAGRLSRSLTDTTAGLNEPERRVIWLLVIAMVIAAGTMFLSMSRGGMVSLLAAFAVTVLALGAQRRLKGHAWVFGLGAFCAVAAVLLFVDFEAVFGRFATLSRFESSYGRRDEILRDLFAAWKQFPIFGSGLGTHEFVFPMFNRSDLIALASRAENEYAQILEETGVIGLSLVILFVMMVARNYIRCVRDPRPPIRAAAFGLGLGLIAILIHSFSDFGQHVPAVALMTAVTCGLLVSLGRKPSSEADTADEDKSRSTRLRRAVAMALVVGAFSWAALGARVAARAETSWNEAVVVADRMEKQQWQGSNAEFTELLMPAAEASKASPENATYRYWVNVYRWYSIGRNRDPATGKVVLPPRGIEFTKRIVDELNAVRQSCPTFGPAVSLAGQLETFVLSDPKGPSDIRLGFKLAPQNPPVCYAAGLLAVQTGAWEDARNCFAEYLRLGIGFGDVAEVYVRQAARPDLAIALAGNDPDRLLTICNLMEQSGKDKPEWLKTAAQLRAKAEPLRLARLEAEARSSDATPEALISLANIYTNQKNYTGAAECYRRAIDARYDEVSWHLALADVLLKAGNRGEAAHEAEVCLKLRPELPAASALLKQASRPATSAPAN